MQKQISTVTDSVFLSQINRTIFCLLLNMQINSYIIINRTVFCLFGGNYGIQDRVLSIQ